MPFTPERLAPQWLVPAVAVAADGLLLSYNVTLGLAAGALLAVLAAVWLYLALRYGSLSGTPSARVALAQRVRAQDELRRRAVLRSRAQQGSDPAEDA
ncbi:hypothetical protein [Porphyrobacter sp. YT40]|uniref:hypothetical protein n=1 Tax=Porphyrobacter sp. YT40 TaxID=2547601 RepID=UPI0011440739|nr:hypothetical protein [Porphyrobacter sp. YT40]QDH33070.1 hypothetical protein E2E27_01185 [Porphyrobacter sp. YT40]